MQCFGVLLVSVHAHMARHWTVLFRSALCGVLFVCLFLHEMCTFSFRRATYSRIAVRALTDPPSVRLQSNEGDVPDCRPIRLSLAYF